MKVVYPGSFDPITFGHIDVIKRSNLIFSEVIIAIPAKSSKKSLLSPDTRCEIINNYYENNPAINAVIFDGMLVDWMREHHYRTIIRGIRDGADMAQEWRMAHCNKNLDYTVETLFLAASPTVSHISSSLVREVIDFAGDVTQFIPEQVASYLEK